MPIRSRTEGGMVFLKRRMILSESRLDRPRRRFVPASDPAVGRRLDEVVAAFADGYNGALLGFDADPPGALRGFACEGAAMSLTLLDLMTLSGGRRLRNLAEENPEYTHLIHVGAGWAYARLRLKPWTGIRWGTPVLRWLAWDGYGFHQAFFGPQKIFGRMRPGPVPSLCDQGAGRALWFYVGADPDRTARVIDGFPGPRRGDLWAGIGLAAAYTGAQGAERLERLADLAGSHRADLAQGAAFAAKARTLAAGPGGRLPSGVAAAVTILTGTDPETAALRTDEALEGRPDTLLGYQSWRAAVREELSAGLSLPGRTGRHA